MRRILAVYSGAVLIAGCVGGAMPASPSDTAGSTVSTGSSSTSTGLAPIGAGLQGRAGLAATVYATGIRQASAFAFDPGGGCGWPRRRTPTAAPTVSGWSRRQGPRLSR